MFQFLHPPSESTIPFLTLSSFLCWFAIGRIFTHFFPNFYLTIGDNHIHHFAYGIIMLSILSYTFLAYQLSRSSRLRCAILLGIALSWAYDEFIMWLTLKNIYYDHRSYDAILTISLVFLNLIYFPGFWTKWGKRFGKLINILLLGLPKKFFNVK